MNATIRYCCILIYGLIICLFQIGLRYLYLLDYMELCYGCTQMDSLEKPYDYIVVGSGSAGSIVARRLAENPNIKVLLLEAGSHDAGLLKVPSMGVMLQKSVFDWQYETVPQKHACLGMDNHVSFWPMGKIWGGTNMLNNLVYVRGHPEDFSSWYSNKTDFDYNSDILYYFNKMEMHYNNSASDVSTGSVKISNLTYFSSLSDAILNAAKSLCLDIHDGLHSVLGFARPKAMLTRGQRFTTARHLKELHLPNVVIRNDVIVDKVLLKNKEAYGVRYKYWKERYYARATRGVILAAGVIGTPKILMLSGIGPKRHLQSVGIPLKIDLPVGNNLQDHISTGLDLVLLNTTLDMGIEKMLSPFSAYDFFMKGAGPWTTIGCEAIGFLSTNSSSEVPDFQLMVLPVGVTSDDGVYLRKLSNIGPDLYNNYFGCIDSGQTAITIMPIVLHPKSRGTVRLKNKNPRTKPLIDPKYLTDSYDLDVLVKGIEFIKKLISTKSMRRLGAKLNPNLFPGCAKYDFDTKPYWECYVRHLTITSYHPVGTCKLGEVVDYDFQIRGAKNLYVVDGSVLPSLPSGNPNAAIMMMAEKAADTIKYHQFMQDKKCSIFDLLVPKILVC